MSFRTIPSALALLTVLLVIPPEVRAEDDPAEKEAREKEEKILKKARGYENALIRVIRRIRPMTVAIENWRPRGRGGPMARASGGSGVLISAKGHLLTNQHVIKGAKALWVVLHDGRRLEATVVGADERGDIALLKVNPRRIKYVNPNRAKTEALEEGAWVLAVGNPFFTAASGEMIATLGIVSGLGRVAGGEFMYGAAIQHDAEINPGNSGGPLFDLNGNLLGINGRIASVGVGRPSNCGVGYTIPMHQVRNFFDSMLEGERKTKHGDELIGLKVSTAKDDQGVDCGVRIDEIKKGSPVRRSRGAEVGDVVWQIVVKGKFHKIFNRTEYINVLSTLASGAKVTLYVKRGKRKLTFRNIALGEEG